MIDPPPTRSTTLPKRKYFIFFSFGDFHTLLKGGGSRAEQSRRRVAERADLVIIHNFGGKGEGGALLDIFNI